MRRTTIIPSFSDTDRLRSIFRVNPDTRLYAKPDHSIIYAENKNERFVAADRWNISIVALGEFMQANGDKYTYTSPSSFAMSLYRKEFAREQFTMPVGDFRSAFCRDALYGGRCEVYKFGKQYMYQYDINSSYPHSATLLDFPNPKSIEYVKPTLQNIYDYEGVSEVVFTQESKVPILPLRYLERVVYGNVERATGRYTHTELRYAIERGVTVHSIVKQYIGKQMTTTNPFDEFVDFCYHKRLDTGLKLWKQVMNGLFGRLSTVNNGLLVFKAATNKEQLITRPKYLKDYFGLSCYADELKSPPDANTLWAAMVLSHARIKLHQKVDWNDTYYIDTDCVIKSREDKRIALSEKLGGMKLKEGTYDIRGAKQYTYTSPEENVKIVMKGVPSQFATLSRFYAAQLTQERLINDDGTTSPIEIPHGAVYERK